MMSLKERTKKLLSSRNVLIILVIICIIIVAYILITNYSGETEKVLSVKDVLNQKQELINKNETITVKGYYNYYSETKATVTDSRGNPGSTPTPSDSIFVDHSRVKNVDLTENSQYLFTGVLEKYDLNPGWVILIASEIEPS